MRLLLTVFTVRIFYNFDISKVHTFDFSLLPFIKIQNLYKLF